MPTMTVLIKPVSSRCNLKCDYCFYEDESKRRSIMSYGMMSMTTLEVMIKKTLAYATDQCQFLFQGGEPTLVGLDFYEQVRFFQEKYNVHQVQISNSIQTNGVLLDEQWGRFFKKNQFLVGLSLDGIEETHNHYRQHSREKGSFQEVLRAVQLLRVHEVPFNILTVVTDQLAAKVKEVYAFYQEQQLTYLQFIPCLDSLKTGECYLSCESYTDFLIQLFDLWIEDIQKGRFVSIRYFDDLINILCHQYPSTCGMLGRCGNHYVIEATGNVYPCDFYVLDEYELGNILNSSWEQLEASRLKSQFNEPILVKPKKCLECTWYRLCYGGCRREREPLIDREHSMNQYCESYQAFLKTAYPKLKQISDLIKQTSLSNS